MSVSIHHKLMGSSILCCIPVRLARATIALLLILYACKDDDSPDDEEGANMYTKACC